MIRNTTFIGSFVAAILFGIVFAVPAHAASLEVSGWLPYWRLASSTADAVSHFSQLSEVMPLGFQVQNDGSIQDLFGFNSTSPTSTANKLIAAAHAAHVKVVPTISWGNASSTQAILSNSASRQALETSIANLVIARGLDGIDIDFENKLADTRPYFSLFLRGLYQSMGQKWVYCSIEARTPPSSAFATVPAVLDYANDYTAVNKYCDRVELMTYDQDNVDLKLNAANGNNLYMPIADPAWVTKVVQLAEQSIAKNKIMIGVATYGYEYDLTTSATGKPQYSTDWSFDPNYATALAASVGTTPGRNSAGELDFVYQPAALPSSQSQSLTSSGQASTLSATSGQVAPASSSPAATANPLHLVWWSDAVAISQKVNLAKALGVRGVSIFKIDGGEDAALWNLFPAK